MGAEAGGAAVRRARTVSSALPSAIVPSAYGSAHVPPMILDIGHGLNFFTKATCSVAVKSGSFAEIANSQGWLDSDDTVLASVTAPSW